MHNIPQASAMLCDPNLPYTYSSTWSSLGIQTRVVLGHWDNGCVGDGFVGPSFPGGWLVAVGDVGVGMGYEVDVRRYEDVVSFGMRERARVYVGCE